VRPVSAEANAPLIVTSAKILSGPVGPGVGKAFELDAEGSGVGLLDGDPATADGPDGLTWADDDSPPWPEVCEDTCADDAPGCDALTSLVTGAEGPPECEAMQAVLARASAATPQLVAMTRKTLARKALKVSMAQILARQHKA
jgi:hypothetical protein